MILEGFITILLLDKGVSVCYATTSTHRSLGSTTAQTDYQCELCNGGGGLLAGALYSSPSDHENSVVRTVEISLW